MNPVTQVHFVHKMHYGMCNVEISDHKYHTYNNSKHWDDVNVHQQRTSYQDVGADRYADNTRCNARDVFADIDGMTDMDEKVREQR